MKVGLQITLDVKDRLCVVVGGGEEATDKVNRLLDAQAKVTVVSPTVTEGLQRLAAVTKIVYRNRRFLLSDVEEGVVLVVNTVRGDETLGHGLYAAARQKGFLLCSTDRPEYSTCTMPALVAKGSLRIAISTSGVSPALASRLRQDLEPLFDERFETFLRWLETYRMHLQATEPDIKKRHTLLRDTVEKVRLHAKIEFPDVEASRKERD